MQQRDTFKSPEYWPGYIAQKEGAITMFEARIAQPQTTPSHRRSLRYSVFRERFELVIARYSQGMDITLITYRRMRDLWAELKRHFSAADFQTLLAWAARGAKAWTGGRRCDATSLVSSSYSVSPSKMGTTRLSCSFRWRTPDSLRRTACSSACAGSSRRALPRQLRRQVRRYRRGAVPDAAGRGGL